MKKTNNYKIFIIFIIIYFLCLLFPYSGDDIAWSLNTLSIDTIKTFSHDLSLNGRYLGNILTIIITKNMFVKATLISLTISLIICLIQHIFNIKYRYILFLLLIMPIDILKQSIVWASGFANYGFSTLFLLITIVLVQKMWHTDKININSIWLLICSFCSCLFVENLTVFMISFFFILNIIYYIKNHRINYNILLGFVSVCIGTFIMFSHPVYINIFNGGDNYRNIADKRGIFHRIMSNYGLVIKNYVIEGSALLFIIMLSVTNKYYKKTKDKMYSLLFNYSLIYLTYAIISNMFLLEEKLNYILYLNILLSIIFIISFIIIIIKVYKDKNDILNIMLIIIGILGPLFIVTPIGPRNLLMIYILEIILLFTICKETNYILTSKKVDYMILLISSILSFCYFNIYGNISYYYHKRLNYLKTVNMCSNEIILFKIPNGEYLWQSEFEGNSEYFIKQIYHIDDSSKLTYVDYDIFINKK